MDKSNKICYSKIDKAKRGEPGDPIRFRFTERIVDRDSEVIEPKGIDLKNYKKNPVVLWSHQGFSPTIGKVIPDSIEKTDQYIDGDIVFDVGNDGFAAMIDGKIRDGFLNTGSIGFNYIMIGREPVLPNQKGVTVLKSELLEFSICNVPANTNATRKQYEEFFDECETFGKEYSVDRVKFFDDYTDMFKAPDETKAGAVLNANNREAIKKAVDSIDNLKTSLDGLSGTLQKILETATPKPDDKSLDGTVDSIIIGDITTADQLAIKQFNDSIEKLQLVIKPINMESFDTLAKVASMFNID